MVSLTVAMVLPGVVAVVAVVPPVLWLPSSTIPHLSSGDPESCRCCVVLCITQ